MREGFGVQDEGLEPAALGGGAALRAGDRGWVLAQDDPGRALGPALAWARSKDVTELHVLAEDEAGVLARRARAFADPPQVWQVTGRAVAAADPVGHLLLDGPSDGVDAAALARATDLLRAAGADVLVEHGEVVGEVLGLEVARVVVDDQGTRLEVGVGRHDREAFALLHGELPPEAAVAKVVSSVREHRRAGATPHPLNRLAAERWLRARLLAEPSLVGAAELHAVAPTRRRASVKDVVPAPATGVDRAGMPVVVVASVGIDLDLVPSAADVRARDAEPDARLVLVVPERDAHAATRALAGRLVHPAEVVTVPGDWAAGPGGGPGPAAAGSPAED